MLLTWALNHTSITVSHSQVWAVYERNCPPKLEVSSGIISSQISRIVRPNTGCLIHCKLFAIWIDLSLSYCFPIQTTRGGGGWGEKSVIRFMYHLYPCWNIYILSIYSYQYLSNFLPSKHWLTNPWVLVHWRPYYPSLYMDQHGDTSREAKQIGNRVVGRIVGRLQLPDIKTRFREEINDTVTHELDAEWPESVRVVFVPVWSSFTDSKFKFGPTCHRHSKVLQRRIRQYSTNLVIYHHDGQRLWRQEPQISQPDIKNVESLWLSHVGMDDYTLPRGWTLWPNSILHGP